MKKLFAFINTILAMLSTANKKIIKLRQELTDTRFELESTQHDVESASGIINKWMSMYHIECEQTRKALENRDRYRRVWLKTIDRYVDLLDKMDVYMEKYHIYEQEAQEEEQAWMDSVVRRYPTKKENRDFDFFDEYKCWIDRIKIQEDKDYQYWVERELGYNPLELHWWDMKPYDNFEFEEDDYPWFAE